MGKIGKIKNNKKLQKETNKLLGIKKENTSTFAENDDQESKYEQSLQQQLKILQNKLDSFTKVKDKLENIDRSNLDNILNNLTNDQPATDKQLYGKDYQNEEMVLLKNNVFCKRIVFQSAIGSSFKASHLARRLIDGVFKIDAILECTLSGQAPKAQGEEKRNRKYECLNSEARKAIIDFSTEYAKEKGWPLQSQYELKRSMTQKIGEIKRNFYKRP